MHQGSPGSKVRNSIVGRELDYFATWRLRDGFLVLAAADDVLNDGVSIHGFIGLAVNAPIRKLVQHEVGRRIVSGRRLGPHRCKRGTRYTPRQRLSLLRATKTVVETS